MTLALLLLRIRVLCFFLPAGALSSMKEGSPDPSLPVGYYHLEESTPRVKMPQRSREVAARHLHCHPPTIMTGHINTAKFHAKDEVDMLDYSLGIPCVFFGLEYPYTKSIWSPLQYASSAFYPNGTSPGRPCQILLRRPLGGWDLSAYAR